MASATYDFVAAGVTAGGTSVSPISHISSGTQIKHTTISSSYMAMPTIPPVSATTTLAYANTPTDLPSSGGTITGTVTLGNSGQSATALDDIDPTLPAGFAYVPGTTTYNGAPAPDPSIVNGQPVYVGTYPVPAGGSSVLTFQVQVGAPTGTYTTDVVGHIGTTPIDSTTNGPASAIEVVGNPAPTLSGLSPASATTAGGATVTITGTNLSGATAVDFGAGNPGVITAESATSITVTAPAHIAGTVALSVTTSGGTTASTTADQFTYTTPTAAPPTLSGLSPASATTAGGATVTITGTNLSGATAVDFGAGNPGVITAESATSITVTAPAHIAGTVALSVTTSGGTTASTTADQFTYTTPTAAPPTLSGLSPASATTAGGATVTITGTNLSGATAVDFGAGNPGVITAESATSITVTAPAHIAGTVALSVTTSGGTTASTTADQFTYTTVTVLPPPTLTSGQTRTSIVVSASPNPATVGQTVTYTATVSPAPDGATVSFVDNGATLAGCGAVAVNTTTGQATCTITYNAATVALLSVDYSGDTAYMASSGSATDTINAGVPGIPPTAAVRLAGATRVTTAVAISQAGFPIAHSAKAVVLAREDIFPDALTGGPLAVTKDGPLLLSAPSALDPATLTEIQRVLTPGGTVYLLGGTAALSDSVSSTLVANGFVVVRVSGPNRFATAVAIARVLGNPTTTFEASGLNFPDALSAGPAAVATHGAILLTNGAVQSPATTAYLQAHPGGTSYAVGGPAASADPGATALVGPDRFDTAVAVANRFFTKPTMVGMVTGTNFPDALSADPLLGAQSAPMLLVNSTGTPPGPVAAYLESHKASITNLEAFGGSAAVSGSLLAAAQSMG